MALRLPFSTSSRMHRRYAHLPRSFHARQGRKPFSSMKYLTLGLTKRLLMREDSKKMIRSEEHTSELQSLMRISYAVFCLKKKTTKQQENTTRVNRTDQK